MKEAAPARMRIAASVARAIARNEPVVALETTVVTHGLPQPRGVETARAMLEEVVRAGAHPALVAVMRGAVQVGLGLDELAELAAAPHVTKVNLSNLAAAIVTGALGSTTVATTMLAARASGIQVFATGGIGGVHRDASASDDVSADLTALARFPVAVVCSGAKAILDLPRTVERLETLGVPVYGYGCDEFPAFWRRASGLAVDQRFDDVLLLARAIREHWALATGTGVVVANPIPAGDELAEAVYERALAEGLERVRAAGVRGREVTPWLLEHMQKATGGKALEANVALLLDNARVAGELAVALNGD